MKFLHPPPTIFLVFLLSNSFSRFFCYVNDIHASVHNNIIQDTLAKRINALVSPVLMINYNVSGLIKNVMAYWEKCLQG
jgi:hypothetical protein